MSATNYTSSAELMAHRWFTTFNNHKMLLGFGSMLLLTMCSIYFNMKLGRLNASPSDLTWWVMPASYSFLDVALLCIGMALFAHLITGFLKVVSWVWFAFLLILSLWACLSCIIALDAEKASTGDAFKRQQLELALNQSNRNVETWQTNFERTDRHKSRFQDRLDQAIAQRDDLINQIAKLDSSTPPAQVIFEKFESFLPIWMSADMFKTLARLIFGIAMVCTPLVLAAILAQVLGSHAPQSRRREPLPENTVSPSENEHFGQNKWPNFNSSPSTAPMRAELSESPQKQGRVDGKATLNREALAKVREWLEGETGRVTRNKIKYRSGNLNYENVSLIIESLLETGHLERMGNGQLRVGENRLKAVV